MECNLDGSTIHYEVFGDGRPILMLHGWPGDHTFMMRLFEPVFDSIDGWKRIYLDLPGMGKTPGTGSIKTHDDMLNILIEFIGKIIKNESFYIIGFSYGAYLSQGIIHRMQDSIDGIIMCGPLVFASGENRILPERIILNPNLKFVEKMKAIDNEQALSLYVDQNEDYFDFIINVGMPAIARADNEFLDSIDSSKELSFIREGKTITSNKPGLFITGKQDHLVGYEDAWHLSKSFPRSTFAVLDYCGHLLGVERPMVFQALVKDWIDRCEKEV